ncbi:hypothetical protein [Bacillus halotolerans]|uniref:hypothetical protein n=1 Tax=Bacillus halotolerans TaxID=260554 RepID=UPI002406C293|nr:hypothetical protein [Bacillus halotolerans]MDG0768198.1 hypothetical protein [Bacillus halotolerans]
MPHIQVIEYFTQRGFAEDTVYTQGTVTDGFGKASGLVVEVTKGAEVDVNIDFELMTVSEARFSEWKTRAYDYLSTEQRSYLEEHHRASGKASWCLAAFGAVSASGNYDHYRNKTDTFNAEGVAEREGFMKSFYDLEATRHRVSGNVKVTGQSHIPSKASVFIHVLKITFSDGRSIQVIDSNNAVAADPSTLDPSKSQVTDSKLNEVEM